MSGIKAGSQRWLFTAVLLSILTTQATFIAHATSPAPATPTQAPTSTPSAHPDGTHQKGAHQKGAQSSAGATPAASATSKKHGLTQAQKDALAAAQTTYKTAVQSALDGANKAVADARSVRDQALAASPQDKNVKALAINDFKSSSTQIWSAFKASVAQAKAAYDAAVAAIKNGN